MPQITLKVIQGEFDQPAKNQLIRRLTDALADTVGEGVRAHTWVLIDEVASGSWGIGGRALMLDADTRKPVFADEAGCA